MYLYCVAYIAQLRTCLLEHILHYLNVYTLSLLHKLIN